jgi:hypothetical protein
MKRHKIIMKISEAIERLGKIEGSNLRKELKRFPANYWLIEGDIPKKDGQPQFYIIEDTPENNAAILGHTPIDLNYGTIV